jgi:putative ABC transport system permease protein
VLLSNLIALPFAYFIPNRFLDFAYSQRIPLGIDIFIFALMVTFVAAVLAVISQILKAACANPVDTLRYE